MFGMALARPSLTMQLTSGVDVFEHVCGQKADTSSNCPRTYLQRPSPWGRATAERQDVESHSYRNAEDILSTFIQPADVGSHHLEY